MELVLIDTVYARVTVNIDQKLGEIEWKGPCSLEQYQECFSVLLDYQSRNTVKYFLSDIRNQGIMNPNNRQWFESVALPQAIRQGLLRSAVVSEDNIFKRYYVNLILHSTNKMGLPLRIFDSREQAIEWLFS